MRLLPRDEYGHPRPLRGHREALRWAARTVARPFFSRRSLGGLGGGLGGASLVRYLSEEEPPDPLSFVFILAGLAAFGVLLWLMGTALLYLYAVLHGGVEKKGHAERTRGT